MKQKIISVLITLIMMALVMTSCGKVNQGSSQKQGDSAQETEQEKSSSSEMEVTDTYEIELDENQGTGGL